MLKTTLKLIPGALLLFTLASGCGGGVGSEGGDDSLSEAALSSNEHTAFNYFVAKGLSRVQAAGIVGNLMQESSMNPTIRQYGGGPGRGIAQWSAGGRWDTSYHANVVWYAAQHGQNPWALGTQLDFIWYELTHFGYGLSQLRQQGSISGATLVFMRDYEICGQCESTTRIHYAQEAFNAYAGGSGGSSGAGCYSNTLGREEPNRACVQSRYDRLWYQCSNGHWVDRWSDPDPCNGIHPL